MKTAFLTTTFENTTNGPAKFARLLHQYSLENKKEIIFISEDVLTVKNSVIKMTIPTIFKISGLGMFYRMVKFYVLVRKAKDIDLVVANNTMYNSVFHLISKKKCIGFINDNEHFKKKKFLSYTGVRSKMFNNLEKFSLKRNALTIVNSNFLKNEILQNSKKQNSNIEVLYKGIEINERLNLLKHDNDDIFKIAFVKTNYSIGGLDTLLKAIENNSKIHLEIVTSDSILSDPIMDLIKKSKFTYQIRHKLNQHEVFSILKKSHCVCIPSNIEALGVANMEGMLHSCLIISSNVGGIPEVLDNGRVGIMVDPGDFMMLQDKIKFAHSNREFRKLMVKDAHDYIEKFSIKNTLDKFFKIISE